MVKEFLKKLFARKNDKDIDEFTIDGQVTIEVKDENGNVKTTQTHDI